MDQKQGKKVQSGTTSDDSAEDLPDKTADSTEMASAKRSILGSNHEELDEKTVRTRNI